MAAITFPLDLLATFPGWSTKFELQYRQERSRTAGGRTIAKDLGSPIWRATYQSKEMRPNSVDEWRARLESMDGGLQTFLGYNMSRCYPILYPRGTWPTGSSFTGLTASLENIQSDRKRIDVTGLPAGFKFSVGDMLQIGDTDLHRVMNVVTASGAGTAVQVEIRPGLWPAAVIGLPVSVRKPHCIMSIDPDTIDTQTDKRTGRGSIVFDAWEAR